MPHPTAASHFATAPLHAAAKDPLAIAALIVRLTQVMYFAALEAPAQSQAAPMLSRIAWIAAGFWHRFVVQASSPQASRGTIPVTPVRSRTDAIASERNLAAPCIRLTPFGLDGRSDDAAYHIAAVAGKHV